MAKAAPAMEIQCTVHELINQLDRLESTKKDVLDNGSLLSRLSCGAFQRCQCGCQCIGHSP
jgi:hypothetical protein